MNKYQPIRLLAMLLLLPSWAYATGVRIYNPFSDPIVVQYQICTDEGCRPSQLRLINSKTESYLRLDRHDCIIFSHVNTLEGQYKLKTYNNQPCKMEMRGIEHEEGGITFYQPEQYYDYQMLCQIEVTGPPRSFIMR